jgi:hypothetical protein
LFASLDAVTTLAALLREPLDAVRGIVERAAASASSRPVPSTLLAPIDGETELWAAGVTYRRPEAARIEESATPDIYARPELNRSFDELVSTSSSKAISPMVSSSQVPPWAPTAPSPSCPATSSRSRSTTSVCSATPVIRGKPIRSGF